MDRLLDAGDYGIYLFSLVILQKFLMQKESGQNIFAALQKDRAITHRTIIPGLVHVHRRRVSPL